MIYCSLTWYLSALIYFSALTLTVPDIATATAVTGYVLKDECDSCHTQTNPKQFRLLGVKTLMCQVKERAYLKSGLVCRSEKGVMGK